MTIRFASLFSGCGGLDLGFEQAGYRCTAAFDLDKHAVHTYQANIGSHIHLADISSCWEQIAQELVGTDVLVAGPPCQGFSTAGKNDPNDARNSLLLRVADIASIVRSKVVVIENVRGLLGPAFSDHWNELLRRLAKSGYKVSYKVVNACNFGVPQNRTRVIIVATMGPHPIEIEFPAYEQAQLRSALSDIEADDHNVKFISSDSPELQIARAIKQGQKLCNVRGGEASVHTWNIPKVFGSVTPLEEKVLQALLVLRRKNRKRSYGDADPVPCRMITREVGFPTRDIIGQLLSKKYVRRVGRAYDLTHAFNGKFRRLSWNGFSPTVDTRFGQSRYFLHPDEHRGFTVREAARIQGFPDSFRFRTPDSVAFRLIGNAVPPPMARAIAALISARLRDGSCS